MENRTGWAATTGTNHQDRQTEEAGWKKDFLGRFILPF
jgi:hypothetical protein